ncbi:MAG: hypothetical protein LBC18_12845, partial [Opitutaceae bacterium]|nr:hypothetical protein [Opitutaceae bacterium]
MKRLLLIPATSSRTRIALVLPVLLASACCTGLLAQSAPTASARPAPDAPRIAVQTAQAESGEEIVLLSPFEVRTERDEGFVAASSLAGGRLGGDLRDTPVAYSVLTREFIEALGLTDMNDMSEWLPNSTDNRGSGELEWSANDYAIQSRGVSANKPQRDFFPYNFNFDSYNIERLDIGRGPNSILFGSSGYGSTPNIVSKRARTGRRFTTTSLSYGSWDNFRVTFDHNQPLGRSFALRLNALLLDREGWQDRDFEKRKAVTLAAVWKPARRTEVRFEAETGKKDKAAVMANFDDYFSAWNGTAVYAAQASANAAAGIARQGANTIVFTPRSGSGFLANYYGWARTVGGNASASYTAGGQIVAGLPANIQNYPILNQLNLPANLYDIAVAHSNFRIPDRSFTTTVDTPLYSENYSNFTLSITRQFGRRLFAEAAVNYATLENEGDVMTSRSLNNIYIDVNQKLPNGDWNTNFLEPYVEGISYPIIRNNRILNARLSLACVLDNTRLGSFRLNFLGGYSRTDFRQDFYTYALEDNADHRYWPSEKQVRFRYYLHTDDHRPYDTSTREWLYLDTTGGTPRTVTASRMRDFSSQNSNNRALTEYDYLQLALDAKFFKKRLNLLAAVRRDGYQISQRATIAQFDYPEDWDGKSLTYK